VILSTKIAVVLQTAYSYWSFGCFKPTVELGKTFGKIPLGLMSVVPGNQTYFIIDNTFSNLNFMNLLPMSMLNLIGNMISMEEYLLEFLFKKVKS
jgi:hypothetical protein